MDELELRFDNTGNIVNNKKKKTSIKINKKELEDSVLNNVEQLAGVKSIVEKYMQVLDIIKNNDALKNLLGRISVNADVSLFSEMPYIFINTQLTNFTGVGMAAGKRTDIAYKFRYPQRLDEVIKYGDIPYRLIGVSYHSGSSGKSGHYVSEVLRNGKLYLCNDSKTTEIEKWNRYDGTHVVPMTYLFERLNSGEGDIKTGGRKSLFKKKRGGKSPKRTKKRRKYRGKSPKRKTKKRVRK